MNRRQLSTSRGDSAASRRRSSGRPRVPPPGYLFTLPAFGLNQERSERRRTIEERTDLVAGLVNGHEPVVVWCQLNDESTAIADAIPDAVEVKGTQSLEKRKSC